MPTELSRRATPWLIGHEEFMDWCKANDIDPLNTRSLSISDNFSEMWVERYELREGKRYVDPANPMEPVVTMEKIRVKVPFPMKFLTPESKG